MVGLHLPVSNRRCFDFRLRAEEPGILSGEVRRRARYFGSGREALVALGRALYPDRPGTVLLPAITPEGLVAPFEHLR